MSEAERGPDHVDSATGLPLREGAAASAALRGRPERIAQARRFALAAGQSLAGDKCEDVVVLDVVERSEVTDFLVIGTGTSQRQVRSAAAAAAELGESMGVPVYRSNLNEKDADWVVLDCVDVVVHVFMAETRRYYDLEMMWSDSPRLAHLNPGTGPDGPGAGVEGRNRAGLRPDDILPGRPRSE